MLFLLGCISGAQNPCNMCCSFYGAFWGCHRLRSIQNWSQVVKVTYQNGTLGKWNQELNPAVCPSSLILSHTHVVAGGEGHVLPLVGDPSAPGHGLRHDPAHALYAHGGWADGVDGMGVGARGGGWDGDGAGGDKGGGGEGHGERGELREID